MRKPVSDCCAMLRLGRQAEGSSLLMPLLESIAARLDSLPGNAAEQIQPSLARALHYQQTHDLIALADELEFVLLPLVEPGT